MEQNPISDQLAAALGSLIRAAEVAEKAPERHQNEAVVTAINAAIAASKQALKTLRGSGDAGA